VCSRDEEYKQKVEHSVEPVVVTFLTSLDDKCKAVASDIEELSDEFTTIKFYQVDVGKHTMLSRALSNTELPIVVYVKNGRGLFDPNIRPFPCKYSGRPPSAPGGIYVKART
jgi:thioredoxin-like negative regulator of GroEL